MSLLPFFFWLKVKAARLQGWIFRTKSADKIFHIFKVGLFVMTFIPKKSRIVNAQSGEGIRSRGWGLGFGQRPLDGSCLMFPGEAEVEPGLAAQTLHPPDLFTAVPLNIDFFFKFPSRFPSVIKNKIKNCFQSQLMKLNKDAAFIDKRIQKKKKKSKSLLQQKRNS